MNEISYSKEKKKIRERKKSQILCHEFIVPNWIHKSLNADIFIFFSSSFSYSIFASPFSTWKFSFLEYDEVNHFSLGREWKDIASHIASYYDFYMLHLNGSQRKKISFLICFFFVIFFDFISSPYSCHLICLIFSRDLSYTILKWVHQFIE